jgi:hypothetical protein
MPYRISVKYKGGQLSQVQRYSRHFEPNPRIGARYVRRDFPLLLEDGEYEASKQRIEQLIASESIIVEQVGAEAAAPAAPPAAEEQAAPPPPPPEQPAEETPSEKAPRRHTRRA